MSSTTSSAGRPERIRSSARLPCALAMSDQSRRTISRPFCSITVVIWPSTPCSTLSAAYFFFFRSNIDLYTPSISISSRRYRLFTSFFTAVPTDITSCRLLLLVLIMMESVSPYTTSRPSVPCARSTVLCRISLPCAW